MLRLASRMLAEEFSCRLTLLILFDESTHELSVVPSLGGFEMENHRKRRKYERVFAAFMRGL